MTTFDRSNTTRTTRNLNQGPGMQIVRQAPITINVPTDAEPEARNYKQYVKPGIAAFSLLLMFGLWVLFTVPVIEKDKMPGNVKYVGGENTHADVRYIDHRPALQKHEAADVWWGTKTGEWRRLEWENGFTSYSGTVAVLRDAATRYAWFGVGRHTRRQRELQAQYEKVIRDYDAESFFSRVWIWKVQTMR